MNVKRALVRGLALAIMASMVVLPLSAEAAKSVRVTTGPESRLTYQGTKGDTTIEGGVTIEYDDVVITSSSATVNIDAGTALLSGGVTLVQGEVTVTAEVMNIYLKEDRAEFSGGVRLTKIEPQAEMDEEGNPVTTTITLDCSTLKISTATQDFDADGDVTVSKGGQVARCHTASYSSSERRIVLEGDVSITGEDNESIRCDRATVYTDRERVEAEGKSMEITFEIED